MNKWIGFVLAAFLLVAIMGYGIGAIAHAFYYTLMIIFSKITFGLMYGFLFLVVIGLVALLIKRK
jgi:hypothetical protein